MDKKYTSEQIDMLNGGVYDAQAKLDDLPAIIDMILNLYDFDLRELNVIQKENYINGRNALRGILLLIRDAIEDAKTSLDEL